MLLLSMFACAELGIGGATPRPGAPPPLPDVQPTAAQQTCDRDADCVALELGCCNHCNGGRVVAVNAGGAAALEAHKQGPCDDFVCTRKMCRPAKVACDQGTCRVR